MKLNKILFFLMLSMQFNLHPQNIKPYHIHKKETVWYDIQPLENQRTKLLPLCFFAHTLKRLSLIYSAYVLVASSLELRKNLGTINAHSWWQMPWCGMQTLYYYSHFLTIVGLALLKIISVHYASSWLIKFTCPAVLRKQGLSDHTTSSDC